MSGDARKGEQFFNGAGGCDQCHSVTGDLAKIGAKVSAGFGPAVALLVARHAGRPR